MVKITRFWFVGLASGLVVCMGAAGCGGRGEALLPVNPNAPSATTASTTVTDPAPSPAAPSQPAPADPGTTTPAPADPGATTPAPTTPAPTTPTTPAPTTPAPTTPAPTTPAPTTPAPPPTIPGYTNVANLSAKLLWDQVAANASELASLTYVIYVDGTRKTLTGVACTSTSGASGFPCQSTLPAMGVGTHTLEVATVLSGLESARSSSLKINLLALLTSATSN
jgi:hypothetical protein